MQRQKLFSLSCKIFVLFCFYSCLDFWCWEDFIILGCIDIEGMKKIFILFFIHFHENQHSFLLVVPFYYIALVFFFSVLSNFFWLNNYTHMHIYTDRLKQKKKKLDQEVQCLKKYFIISNKC